MSFFTFPCQSQRDLHLHRIQWLLHRQSRRQHRCGIRFQKKRELARRGALQREEDRMAKVNQVLLERHGRCLHHPEDYLFFFYDQNLTREHYEHEVHYDFGETDQPTMVVCVRVHAKVLRKRKTTSAFLAPP